MDRLFGTDGIRGRAGEFPLDHATVKIIGASLGRHFRENLGRPARFVTGRDTRESGLRIETAIQAGVRSVGGECESAGVITTPGVAYLAGSNGFDAGIVVSASHNPYHDNGIKVFLPTGKKLDEATERAIEAEIRQAEKNEGRVARAEMNAACVSELQNSYIRHLESQFTGLKLEGMRIVVDCANGAACPIAPRIFRHFGADVVTINDEPDGRNINLNCGSLHVDRLRTEVPQEKADFGVAFDGDADRALFVDEKGELIDGDATLWIMAKHFQEHGRLENKTVVATVMSNIGLEIALASRELKLVRTAVGDRYVLDELMRIGSELGGEQSGHIIFPEHSLVGDGIMTTLFLLEAATEKRKSFSEIANGFLRYPQILVNVPVSEKRPFDSIAPIADAAKRIESELDGSGRLLLRYSGTENLARVMIEGRDQSSIKQQADELASIIEQELG